MYRLCKSIVVLFFYLSSQLVLANDNLNKFAFARKNSVQIVSDKHQVRSFPLWQLAEQLGIPLWLQAPKAKHKASGFFWPKSSLIITSYHVVAGAVGLGVKIDKKIHAARLLGVAVADDLAVLQLVQPLPMKKGLPVEAQPLQQGDDVFCTGFTSQGDWQVKHGIVVDTSISIPVYGTYSPPRIWAKSSVFSGFSGGAVVDQDGGLIGMIVAAEPGKDAYIIAYSRLQQLVEAIVMGHKPYAQLGIWSNDLMIQQNQLQLPEERILRVWRNGVLAPNNHAALQALLPTERLRIETERSITDVIASDVSKAEQLLLQVESPGLRVRAVTAKHAIMGLREGDLLLSIQGHGLQSATQLQNYHGLVEIQRMQERFYVVFDGRD